MRVAWIGTGVMGRSMALHLINAGHELRITTRTRDRAADVLAAGATWCDSPAVAADSCDVAISMVGYPSDVEAVHRGPHGTLSAQVRPRIIIDMTTSTPTLARALAAFAGSLGVASIDAPVSGGDLGARNAALSIMVGGDAATIDAVRPLLASMGKTIVHHGGPGMGQHCKMVNQILIASSMLGLCEALAYAQSSGLDSTKVLESVGGGAAGSWSVNNLGPRILRGDFAPGFFVEHFCKDLR
ncbi:MAG: NAD(P)-dependent oxidoreductase, partial [Phycisphaerae bacterium]|nr:NAD(P)-dependent oxidoreductase [Phycisphaerae bacterium]